MSTYDVCVVGLGYVGLPLAVEFGKCCPAIGFDVKEERIAQVRRHHDVNGDVKASDMRRADVLYTSDPADIGKSRFVIVCVPTPIDRHKMPDLSHLRDASVTVGGNMRKGTIVVYESTVYPGVTEEFCVPLLERESGMKCGRDFKVGYSPERMNPGDPEHSVSKIIKVVAAMDSSSLEKIAKMYGRIVKAGVYRAASIKTAEAAKVIENIQRDLNIALMNELSLIFEKMGLRTREVLEAAGTKWNFHRYYPGLVGGHCIGVDPYYLTYKALELGHHPRVILAGREINDNMYQHVVEMTVRGLNEAGKVLKKSTVLMMGLTFKENVADVRNSKALDVIRGLAEYKIRAVGFDPLLREQHGTVFGIEMETSFERLPSNFDCVIVFSPHRCFRRVGLSRLRGKMSRRPLMIDIKSFYSYARAERTGFIYRSL